MSKNLQFYVENNLFALLERGNGSRSIGMLDHTPPISSIGIPSELQQAALISVVALSLAVFAWFILQIEKKKKKIGHYTLQVKFGEGEITELFLAVNKRVSKEIFFVKKMKPELVNNRDSIVAFEREVEVSLSLNHPNIIKTIGYSVKDQALVMEYIQGRNLAYLIKNYGKLPIEIVLHIAEQLCAGIHHMHCKNLIHCDIKPGNILISHAGEVKLCDFGIAKVLNNLPGPSDSTSSPGNGGLRGTLAYTSPEQLLNKAVGFYSDIYSFGIVCYEMLTGEMLNVFDDSLGRRDSISCIVNQPIPPVVSMREEVPVSLNNLVMCCLSKDTERRFQKTQILLDCIRSIQQESAVVSKHLKLSELVK